MPVSARPPLPLCGSLVPQRNTCRASNSPSGCAPALQACAGPCSHRHAFDSAHFSSQRLGRSRPAACGLQIGATHLPIPSGSAGCAHRVYSSFLCTPSTVVADRPPSRRRSLPQQQPGRPRPHAHAAPSQPDGRQIEHAAGRAAPIDRTPLVWPRCKRGDRFLGSFPFPATLRGAEMASAIACHPCGPSASLWNGEGLPFDEPTFSPGCFWRRQCQMRPEPAPAPPLSWLTPACLGWRGHVCERTNRSERVGGRPHPRECRAVGRRDPQEHAQEELARTPR
jgi:hypothetical protein